MAELKTFAEIGWKLDNSYSRLPKIFYTPIEPTPSHAPKLIIFNTPLATSLGLNAEAMQSDEQMAVFAGNKIPEGAMPLAQAYAGHQYGHFTMLGDGRAMLISEHLTPSGERIDLQLKGSGRTPYSRGGDGKAALGPMLREYIISEAMYGLGIPTTRSLAVVTTGESVIRDTMQTGAILTRVAASHLRVGTFQYALNFGSLEDVKALADYTIERHYKDAKDKENPYLSLLQEVVRRQAALIAKWQLVGFIHGVMNTDNMTISGETIDYGPCAFMDTYDPATVFSSIDRQGRYAYGNQPSMAAWNLGRFAETLLPLLHPKEDQAIGLAEEQIAHFAQLYHYNWIKGMRAKLGLFNEEAEDESLVKNLLGMMQKHQADYTNTFLALTFDKLENIGLFSSNEFKEWHELWEQRLSRQHRAKSDAYELMRESNPAVIPRNHRVEEALEAAVKREDYSVLHKLLNVLSSPYGHTPEQVAYSTLPKQANHCYRTFCGT